MTKDQDRMRARTYAEKKYQRAIRDTLYYFKLDETILDELTTLFAHVRVIPTKRVPNRGSVMMIDLKWIINNSPRTDELLVYGGKFISLMISLKWGAISDATESICEISKYILNAQIERGQTQHLSHPDKIEGIVELYNCRSTLPSLLGSYLVNYKSRKRFYYTIQFIKTQFRDRYVDDHSPRSNFIALMFLKENINIEKYQSLSRIDPTMNICAKYEEITTIIISMENAQNHMLFDLPYEVALYQGENHDYFTYLDNPQLKFAIFLITTNCPDQSREEYLPNDSEALILWNDAMWGQKIKSNQCIDLTKYFLPKPSK